VANYGWRFAYQAMGALLLAAAPLVILLLPWRSFSAGDPEQRREARLKAAGEGWTPRAALRTSVFWGLSQVFFFTATGMFLVVVQLVAFFIDAGFSPLTAASAYGALGMLSATSIMLSGLLADRFGYRQVVTASFAGTATGMLILFFITRNPSLVLLVGFVGIFGMCMGFRGPIISSVCARYFAGSHVATIYGSIYSTNAIGAAFGSYIGGVLHDVTGGYGAGLAVALAAIGLAAAPFWTVRALREFR
jgi:predicted MFS family arabinose efflux permease